MDADAGRDDAPPTTESSISGAGERARLKKLASTLGWKLIGRETVEIKVVREIAFGQRIVCVSGRVQIARPDEFTAEAGDSAIAEIVDPAVAAFRSSIERAAEKILSAPDDVTARHSFEHGSFFTALTLAQRTVIRVLEDLENRRLDARVEADLGLRFYLEGFTHEARSFVYFAGPTNSGKTHAAIELLRDAKSGTYLAPLRLLALEVHERLREIGVPTSLVTGEERVIDIGAAHVSSTVEMVDLTREIDVAVVDEAQMLQDVQRGWAWTLAVAGVRAKTVVLCGSLDGVVAARRLIERLGGTLEVRTFERKNPLHVVDAVPISALRPGDAVVAFSRNAVVELQGQIGRSGRTTAAIYGSLSPAVRRLEAGRFRSGLADVLVATDAIGLGLNLPIRRLIFAEIDKFDGLVRRRLTSAEIRQIAGRAGRYGMHEAGEVTAFDPRSVRILRQSLEHFDEERDDLPVWIAPTDEHLRRLAAILKTTRLSQLLQFFQLRVLRDEASELRIADLSDTIEVASALETSEAFGSLPLETRASYSRAPVTTRGNSLAVLARWGDQHASGQLVEGVELINALVSRDRLLLFEDRSRLATLYLWLALRFPQVYVNAEAVAKTRERTDAEIQSALLAQGVRAKKSTRDQGGSSKKPPRKKGGPPKFDKRRLPK